MLTFTLIFGFLDLLTVTAGGRLAASRFLIASSVRRLI